MLVIQRTHVHEIVALDEQPVLRNLHRRGQLVGVRGAGLRVREFHRGVLAAERADRSEPRRAARRVQRGREHARRGPHHAERQARAQSRGRPEHGSRGAAPLLRGATRAPGRRARRALSARQRRMWPSRADSLAALHRGKVGSTRCWSNSSSRGPRRRAAARRTGRASTIECASSSNISVHASATMRC
jgi:hypothetical protein